LKGLQRGFGHTQMGIYARVTKGAAIHAGDLVEALS
jgi:hypothetical protein